MIIRGADELERHFERLGPDDVVVGPFPPKILRGPLAVDLIERGVRCVPSVLCQLLGRSKAAQAGLFRNFMAPHTMVVTRRAELLAAVGYYRQHGIETVVTKQEGMHCGHGIRRWEGVETLYNTVAFDDAVYPLILQPFLSGLTDVRIIVVGSYIESYARENPLDFRANLAAGGSSRPYVIEAAEEELCRAVLRRGRFPYAHIDLHLMPDGVCHLSEIALDGGITAARIERKELNRLKKERLEELVQQECLQDRSPRSET
jgi:hypothetical protein